MICANPKCGKEFSNFIGDQIIHNKKYCSKSCQSRVKVINRNIKEKQKRLSHKVNLLCVRCGSSFITFKQDQKYCSEKCREKEWKENNKERYNNAKKRWAELNPQKIKHNRENYVVSGKHKEFKKRYSNGLSRGYVVQLLKVIEKKYQSGLIITEELIKQKEIQLKIIRRIKHLKQSQSCIAQ